MDTKDSYRHLLETYTEAFDEEVMSTDDSFGRTAAVQSEVSRSYLADAHVETRKTAPTEGQGPNTATQNALEQRVSPASSSSSSGLTYIDVGKLSPRPSPAQGLSAAAAGEALDQFEAATLSRASQASFKPILPEALRSHQPTPRASIADSPAAKPAAPASPFLSAAASLSGRSQGISPVQQPQRRTQSPTFLSLPRLDLSSPFEAYDPDRKSRSASPSARETVLKPHREVRDEWLERFIQADRELKATRPTRAKRHRVPSSSSPVRDFAQEERFEEPSKSPSGRQQSADLPDPATFGLGLTLDLTLGRQTHEQANLSRSPTISPKRVKRNPQRNARRDGKERHSSNSSNAEERESVLGSDRNMTTEKSIKMLPKRRTNLARIRRKQKEMFDTLSDSDNTRDDTAFEIPEEEDVTDYDECADSLPPFPTGEPLTQGGYENQAYIAGTNVENEDIGSPRQEAYSRTDKQTRCIAGR
ncbi:uncharacterized protein JCM15063_003445 [Sporobolomyces koalae]|uniref:uncharacterized protein n=1 Tax=Sporobolomyces koalae TaxID=500713 RepID=UPI00316DCC97